MKRVTFNDGNSIPMVALACSPSPPGEETYNATLNAIKAGYRHIDTAAAYFNEADVGRAVRDSGVARDELFITSKLWLQDYGYEAATKGIDTSLKNLGMDYMDLYLLHQPYGDVAGAWRAPGGRQGGGQDPLHRREQYDAEDLEQPSPAV